jgi:xanthine dehydrogenase YagS FAD-binding subunit
MYLKAQDHAAGAFPLEKIAIGFLLDAGRIRHARLVLGGIAPVPCRNPAAKAVLEDLPSPSPAPATCIVMSP